MSRPIYKYAVLLPQSKGYDDSEWRVFRESIKGELELADKEIRGDPSKQLILQRNILTEDPKEDPKDDSLSSTTRRNLSGKELAFCIIAGDIWSEKVYAEYFSKAECPIFVVTGLRVSNSSQKLFQWSPSAWTVFFCLTKLACKHVKSELAKRSIEDECVYFHVYYRNDAKGEVVSEICKRTIGEEYKEKHGIYNCSIEELMAQDKKLLHKHFRAKGDHRVIIYGFGSEYSNLLDSIGVLKENGVVINVYGDINALPEIEDDQRIRTDYLVSTFVEEHVRTSPQYMALYYSELIRFCAKVLDKSLSGRNKESLEKKYEGKVGCFFRDKLTEVRFHYSDKYGSIYFANDGGFCAPLYLLSKGKQRSVLPEIQTFSESSTDELAQQLLKIGGYIQEFSPVSMDLNLKISECDSDNTIGTQSLKNLLSKLHAEIFSSYFGATETLFISRLPNTVRDFFSTGIVIKGKEIVDPILEFLDVNGIANSVQINLREQDIEDNGVLRLYVKYGKKKNAIKPYYYWDEGSENADSVVFAHTIELAKSSTKWESVESGNSWSLLLRSIKDLRNKGNSYIYLIPESNVSKKCSFVMLCTSRKLSLFDIQMGQNLVARIFSKIQIAIRENGLMLANIKSAVGSIMSRNGSHNIGSHVLAALSHNVGTLPDDRVLYQYIQQRMDYIATVTTDFPTWTQPTMFVADMMKTFLSQRHLLDHIVESEGLHAFQFQNPNMDDDEWFDQKNCIQIHVRRVGADGEDGIDIIRYDSKDDRTKPLDLKQDIALAIPGGIVGEHAFYTILENIIRNAAKHSWASLNNDEKKGFKNLEICIDFEDKDDIVDFKVYARLPLIRLSVCNQLLEKKAVEDWVEKIERSEGLTNEERAEFEAMPLHHRQQIMLARPFINAQGSLRRENWGLAEMKISAGYLADRSIEDIGGIGERKGTDDILEPRIVTWNGKNCLGYKFKIAKPKEILVIVNNINQWADKDDVMKKKGIFAKTFDEVKKELKLNYRYIVHYDATEFFDVNTYEPKDGILIPFRMLSGRKIEDQKDGVDWKWLQPFVANLDDGKTDEGNGVSSNVSGFEQLQEAFVSGGVEKVQKIVYKAYYTHLKKARNDLWRTDEGKKSTVDIGLLVAINENEKSGGNSLISDADILELMMEQNFAVCVDQYKAFAANEDNRKIIKCLESIRHKSSAKDKVIKFKHLSNKTIRELIAQRMCDWAGKSNDSWIPIVEHLRKKYFVSDAKSETSNELKPSNNEISVDFAKSVNSLLQKHPIDDFIRYAESVFENTKKLFKQYEEQIVTLPAGYKINTASEDEQENEGSDNEVTLEGVKIVTNIENIKKEKDRHWIGYRRHAHTIDGCKRLYVEPLSGTQTYLSQLTKVKDNLGLQMRLIENGLMRILVLDERVAKFLREHQKEVGPHYKAMNINVVDDKWVEGNSSVLDKEVFFTGYTKEITNALEGFAKNAVAKINAIAQDNKNVNNKTLVVDVLNGIYIGGDSDYENGIKKEFINVDILIVHQGILDKWFSDLKSVEGMKYLLEGFKRLVKYVVVTTGRGTPENIPEEAHLLPFAVVESTLFKKYPEKLILTDTIMNVLPVGKKNDNSGGQE